MKIGPYTVLPIETGRFSLDGGAMFGIVPKLLWSKINPPDELNRIELATRSLLILSNEKKILIDNGNGTKFSKKQVDIYNLNMSQFDIISSLRKYGLQTKDITDVILTHLHFDHTGGSTYRENGILKPTFPNAKHYVQKSQWEQALNPTEKDRGSYMPNDFLPLKDYNVLEIVDGEFEIFPYIFILVMNGHTNGLQLVKISDGKTTLLYCSDLFPTNWHIPLPYIPAYDLQPLQTLQEKKRILKCALDENWILFFEHDPSVVSGNVVINEKGYAFGQKIEIES